MTNPICLVFDSSPLIHFARAEKLDVLRQMVAEVRCVAPEAVFQEVAAVAQSHAAAGHVTQLAWLEKARVDGLQELQAFAVYARILGVGARDIGEASVLAWAEVHQATAIIDDRVGKQAGVARNVDVHGSLWLIFESFNRDLLDRAGVEDLVGALVDSEAWFPCTASDAFEWGKRQGLLH